MLIENFEDANLVTHKGEGTVAIKTVEGLSYVLIKSIYQPSRLSYVRSNGSISYHSCREILTNEIKLCEKPKLLRIQNHCISLTSRRLKSAGYEAYKQKIEDTLRKVLVDCRKTYTAIQNIFNVESDVYLQLVAHIYTDSWDGSKWVYVTSNFYVDENSPWMSNYHTINICSMLFREVKNLEGDVEPKAKSLEVMSEKQYISYRVKDLLPKINLIKWELVEKNPSLIESFGKLGTFDFLDVIISKLPELLALGWITVVLPEEEKPKRRRTRVDEDDVEDPLNYRVNFIRGYHTYFYRGWRSLLIVALDGLGLSGPLQHILSTSPTENNFLKKEFKQQGIANLDSAITYLVKLGAS